MKMTYQKRPIGTLLILRTLQVLGFLAFLGGCSRNQTLAPGKTSPGPAAATQSARPSGGELRIGITTEPATLDPLSPDNTSDGRSILFNVFEGLVKLTPEGNFHPAVADLYEIREDGRVYTFRLRPGILFHDGQPVRVEDVVFTLETAMQAGFNGFDQIDRIAQTTENELSLILKTPDLEFLPYLTIGIVPKANKDREKNPIGTGPFSIASYQTQQSLVLEKNPRYWQKGAPHLDKVTYVFIADFDALIRALQGGDVDTAHITSSVAQQLDPSRFDMIPSPSNSVQLLALNNAVPPLNEVLVRQAICYTVDINEIIDAAFYGIGEPSGSPLIPGLALYYDGSLKNPYPKDILKAKELLTKAGHAGGFPLEITVPANYTIHIDTAQVVVKQLAEVGIAAQITLMDWAIWLKEVYQGRNYQATIISLDAPQAAPRGFLARYHSQARSNFVNFSSPAYDQVYDAILEETHEGRRIALYHHAQQIASSEAASVFIQDIWGFKAFAKGRFGGAVHYPLYVFDVSTIYRLPPALEAY